jgi:hypothetical protein
MEFPDDVLQIIRDFSRPVTPPDWRNRKPMPARRLHHHIARTYNKMNLPVINSFLQRYDQIQFTYMYDYNCISRVRYNCTGYSDYASNWPSRYDTERGM